MQTNKFKFFSALSLTGNELIFFIELHNLIDTAFEIENSVCNNTHF